MNELSLIVRTADKTKKAEVSLAPVSTVADIIQGAIDNWALPKDTDYTMVNTSSGKSLIPQDTLEKAGLSNGDVLEIQPVLVAGMDNEPI